jgi:hypothetical protein
MTYMPGIDLGTTFTAGSVDGRTGSVLLRLGSGVAALPMTTTRSHPRPTIPAATPGTATSTTDEDTRRSHGWRKEIEREQPAYEDQESYESPAYEEMVLTSTEGER